MSNHVMESVKYQKIEIDASLVNGLTGLLERAENCSFTVHHEFEKICFSGSNNESRLRIHISFGISPHFVFSVVNLVNQRRGTMTNAFDIAKQFCRSNDIKTIEIQSVSTHAMTQWCKKNAFVPNCTGCWYYSLI